MKSWPAQVNRLMMNDTGRKERTSPSKQTGLDHNLKVFSNHRVIDLLLEREKLERFTTWCLLHLEKYLTDKVEIASHGSSPKA